MENPDIELNKGKEESFEKACTAVPENRQCRKASKNKNKAKESPNPTEDKRQDEMTHDNKKIKITIVGDSQLRFLSTEKMSNYHHAVNKEFKPGMKIREAI